MKSIKNGVYSGMLLFIILYAGDFIFNTDTIFTLLNIDFITQQKETPFLIELIPHLLVSIILFWIIESLYGSKFLYRLAYIILFVLFIVLYYVLHHFAKYPQEDESMRALLIWIIAHSFYLVYIHQAVVKEARSKL